MSYKDRTHDTILRCYKQYGLGKTLDIAKIMLKDMRYDNKDSFRSTIHGELCESVLEIAIQDWARKTRTECVYQKGLIVEDRDFITEIDLVVCTKKQLFVFECKSYNCDKVLKDICQIQKGDYGIYDAYSQNRAHFVALFPQIQHCLKSRESNPVTLALFDFSIGSLKDERSTEGKRRMPVYTADTIGRSMQRGRSAVWDLDAMDRELNYLARESEGKREKHLNYVRRMHSE